MSSKQLAFDLIKSAVDVHPNGKPTFKDTNFTPAHLMALIVDTELMHSLAAKYNFNEQHSTALFTALSYLFASDWVAEVIKPQMTQENK